MQLGPTIGTWIWLVVLTVLALPFVMKRTQTSRARDRFVLLARYLVATFVLLVFGTVYLIFMPHTPIGAPRERSRATVECGELLLTQVFTGTTDPYYVWLYYRPKGESVWMQYFVDFEAPYWWGGLVPQGRQAELTLLGSTMGVFKCDGPTFTRGRHTMEPSPVVNPFDITEAGP